MKKMLTVLVIFLFFSVNVFAQSAVPADLICQSDSEEETESSEPVMVFEDYFTDNSNSWYTGEDEEMTTRIENGKYLFQNKTDGDYYVWNRAYLDDGEDFNITTRIRHTGGVDDYGYGLVWGMEDIDNHYYFLISHNGYYQIGKYKEGEIYIKVEWTQNAYINTQSINNKLTLRKVGDQLKFYINDNYVNQIQFESFFANSLGFVVWEAQTIEIDDLIVEGYKDWDAIMMDYEDIYEDMLWDLLDEE
ncbi:MAG: hypothetical protein JW784_02865 [Candidatus Cloacimonetes bacterium]|nr:hypothetical protein [Candidatus Cloacimonadota bacterium]